MSMKHLPPVAKKALKKKRAIIFLEKLESASGARLFVVGHWCYR
jgi:hypothetical protein